MSTDETPYPPVPFGAMSIYGSVEGWHRHVDEQRAREAEARARWEAKLKADADAVAAKARAQRDVRAQEWETSLKASLRANWRGTDAAFEQNWPAMRDEVLRREAIEQREALLEQKRRQLGGVL